MRIGSTVLGVIALSSTVMLFSTATAVAQNPQLAEKLQDIKAASAANKAALAHYAWTEQQTISLKGEVKKTKTYLVSIGPDGQQQKTEVDASPSAQPSGGRLKQRIIAKKTDEYTEYGQQIAALVKQYAPPDPQLLQQAYQQGNVSLQIGGAAGTVSLVIKNYLKQGDSMTLVFNQEQKSIETVQVSSYLSAPSDAVTMSVQFAKLPSGVNHVASVQVNGVSKQMTVGIQNSNYQPSQ